ARVLLRNDDAPSWAHKVWDSQSAVETANRLAEEAEATGLARAEFARQVEGVTSWLRVTARRLDSWPDHIHWQIDDVSADRRREAALRTQQERLVGFMDQAPVGFFSLDK